MVILSFPTFIHNPSFYRICYKQLLESAQNIRKSSLSCSKIKSSHKNSLNKKEGDSYDSFYYKTYTLKREILSFTNKISKFLYYFVYGISCSDFKLETHALKVSIIQKAAPVK